MGSGQNERVPTHPAKTPPVRHAYGTAPEQCSLAGLPDLELAWRPNVGNGVVSAFLGGSFDEVPARSALASPAALLPLGVWQVLLHGTEDPHVPLTLSQTYAAAPRQAADNISLVELAGIDHRTLREPGSAPGR
ncbi:MAG: hypothetical protein JO202_16005 [Ktedonobacteraceae bacterium]|nr:hypothetical protein [Ktedonobacteraceae bacterium]